MKRKPHAPKTAADIVTERGIQYGDAVAGMTRAAARWSVTLGVPVSAVQVCQCMIDLKQSRLDYAPLHEDSALDIGGYAEIIRRIQAQKRGAGGGDSPPAPVAQALVTAAPIGVWPSPGIPPSNPGLDRSPVASPHGEDEQRRVGHDEPRNGAPGHGSVGDAV